MPVVETMFETMMAGPFWVAPFWVALGKIIGVNILLSGDNAVVIALASRSLPDNQRNKAVIGGSIGAIAMLILFCTIIVWLLTVPYLKLIGGILLLWIGVKLLLPEGEGHDGPDAKAGLWRAVQTIIIADVVMSLDNVVAIAAVAKDSLVLIVIGLLISVPIIIFGSQIVLRVLLRFPILVTAGAGLLGWLAGEIISADPQVAAWIGAGPDRIAQIAQPALAVLVMATGTALARRARPLRPVDLAPEERQ